MLQMLAYLIYSLAMAHDNEVLPLLCWLLGGALGIIRDLNLCGGFFSNLNLGTCKPDQVLSCHSNNLVTTCIDLSVVSITHTGQHIFKAHSMQYPGRACHTF